MVIHWWTVCTTTSVICSTTNSKRRTISPITRWARTARWTRPVSDGRSGITFSACSASGTTITITTRLTSSSSAAWRRSSRAPFVTLNAWPKGITIAWWGNSSTARRLVALNHVPVYHRVCINVCRFWTDSGLRKEICIMLFTYDFPASSVMYIFHVLLFPRVKNGGGIVRFYRVFAGLYRL